MFPNNGGLAGVDNKVLGSLHERERAQQSMLTTNGEMVASDLVSRLHERRMAHWMEQSSIGRLQPNVAARVPKREATTHRSNTKYNKLPNSFAIQKANIGTKRTDLASRLHDQRLQKWRDTSNRRRLATSQKTDEVIAGYESIQTARNLRKDPKESDKHMSHAKGILRAALRSSNAGPVIKPSLVASNDVGDLTSRMEEKRLVAWKVRSMERRSGSPRTKEIAQYQAHVAARKRKQ